MIIMISMKLDEGGRVYGAGVLLRHVQSLEKEFAGVHAGDADIEYIHRMRVASRRLRAALPLFIACLPAKRAAGWLKEIRAVTRALGAARDADVQIENLEKYRRGLSDPLARPGVSRLLLRLIQQRAKLQPGLTRALDELRASAALEGMRTLLEPLAARAEGVYLFTPALYAHGFASISTRLDELLAFDAIVDQVEKVTELHQMRIAAKQLRYTLETFAPLYPNELKDWLAAVRTAQDDLGEIHDCDVWAELIPAFLEKERQRVLNYLGHTRPFPRMLPGIEGYAAARKNERDERYERFKARWAKWKEKDLWGQLRQALQTPGMNEGNHSNLKLS
jgi:CHAD domain-containing protein